MKCVIVFKSHKKRESKKTDGFIRTVVLQDMETKRKWTTWPDTTFKSWTNWENLKVGDIVTGVGIYDEARNMMSATSFPQKIGHLNLQTGEVTNSAKDTSQEELFTPAHEASYEVEQSDGCTQCKVLSGALNRHLVKDHQISIFGDDK